MKKTLILAFSLISSLACIAQQRVIFTPRWTSQAQFAGYYVAKEKGFFKDEGLDVEIRHLKGTSNVSAVEMLRDGQTEIIVSTVFEALEQADDGLDLVNFLQTSQYGGLMCVSNTPVRNPKVLAGKKIASFKKSVNQVAELYFKENKIPVTWVPSINGINLLLAKAVDAVLCYSFNEYIRLLFAKGEIPSENVVRFSDLNYDFPADGLFCKRTYYEEHSDIVEAFRRASIQGWDYCRAHKEEALKIVRKYTQRNNVKTNDLTQQFMLDEVLRLQENRDGHSSFASITEPMFNRMYQIMKKTGVIKKQVKYNEFIK